MAALSPFKNECRKARPIPTDALSRIHQLDLLAVVSGMDKLVPDDTSRRLRLYSSRPVWTVASKYQLLFFRNIFNGDTVCKWPTRLAH